MSGATFIGRVAAVCLLLAGMPSIAQEAPAVEDPNAAVWEAASKAMLRGPQTIELVDQAKLQLPEGYGFVPRAESERVMEVMGNQTGPSFLGLVFPLSDAQWFVTVDFEESGYIKDEEAKDWDADGLLKSLKEGTEAANEHRADVGVPPIKVTRWIEPPSYNAAAHELVWSAEIRLRDGEDPDPGVNYNTYVLGREGCISLDLVTSVSTVEADKPIARELLTAVSFNDGKRYEDFNASTDKVAAYGIAALVGGAMAKKLGLLAAIAAFAAKFAKIIFVGVAAFGVAITKWFKGRSQSQE